MRDEALARGEEAAAKKADEALRAAEAKLQPSLERLKRISTKQCNEVIKIIEGEGPDDFKTAFAKLGPKQQEVVLNALKLFGSTPTGKQIQSIMEQLRSSAGRDESTEMLCMLRFRGASTFVAEAG